MARTRSTKPNVGDSAIDGSLPARADEPAFSADFAALDQLLTTAFFRVDCPPALVWGEYEIGLLSAAETRALDAHLQRCPHCTSEIATLRSYLSTVAPSIAIEPTPTLVERARVLIGRLAEDLANFNPLGGLVPAPAGIRGDVGDQLVYTVDHLGDEVQVMIDIQTDAQNPTQRTLLGLVLGLPTPEQITAHLWHTDQATTTTPVDALGNFVIAGLPPGAYDLILSSDKAEIHLQNLSI